MKIKRFIQLNEASKTKIIHKNEYYVIKKMFDDEEFIIPADENEYERNYDPNDLKDVVRYYRLFCLESRRMPPSKRQKTKIQKIIEEDVDQKTIDKILKQIEMEENAEKYNL